MQLLGPDHPHVFRELRTPPAAASTVAALAVAEARRSRDADDGCLAWAVHVAHDGSRVISLLAWRNAESFARRSEDAARAEESLPVSLYEHVGTAGTTPAPVSDVDAGVIVIDRFRVWRPLVRAVSAFNARNGRNFAAAPGGVSTTVWRSTGDGQIATYARWRRIEDFLAAFTALQGAPVHSTQDVNDAAAERTRGLIRTDYHTYELVDVDEGGPS